MTRSGCADVLLVDLAARSGGAEKRVVQLAEGLVGRGLDVRVVCLAGGVLASQLRARGLPHLTVDRGRGDPRVALELARCVRLTGAGVLDAHNVQSQLWGVLAAALCRVPRRVATVHSEYRWSEGGRAKGLAYDAVLRLAARARWDFIAVSESVRARLQVLGAPQARTVTVWSGVPEVLGGQDRARARHALDLSPGDFAVLALGRLVPAKDHALLLAAVARVVPDLPQLTVLLAGDGPERDALQAQVRRLGLHERVRLLGHREDVPDLLAAADLCILTSRTEGLPYALLEAAAAGVPVLSTRAGSVETVFEDGRTALLVDCGDAEQVAAALRRAAGSPAAMRAQAERARAAVAGDFEVMLDRTLEAYGLAAVP